MNNYATKREGFVKNFVEGAQLVVEFFDEVIRNPNAEPMNIARELSPQHNITLNQYAWLMNVAWKVSQAREIVEKLKKDYGVGWGDKIKDRDGLYRVVYDEEPPKEEFWVIPSTFAIGFYLSAKHFNKKDLGDTEGYLLPNFFTHNLVEIISGTKDYEGLRGISFRVNYEKLEPKTEQHELKHIIDLFINPDIILGETSAELFEGGLQDDTFSRDLAHLRQEKRKTKEREQIRRMNRQIRNFSMESIERLIQRGLDTKLLSYIIAMTNFNKLEHRLELVNNCI